jgi:hypothetical protein
MVGRAAVDGSWGEGTGIACNLPGSKAAIAAPMGTRNLLYFIGGDYIPLVF